MSEPTPESNKDIAIRLYRETFDNHDLGIADKLLAPGFIFHNAGSEIRGREGWRAFAGDWLTGFPDLGLTVDFAMAEDDRVLLHWRGGGTHTGEFRGTPATGGRISASGLTLFRLSSGRIEEMWDETEAFGELQALAVT